MQRLWSKDFILVTLSTFFVFFNLQMITPALSMYIKEEVGGNSLIGLSTAVWALTAVITRLTAGNALVTVSKRRVAWMGIVIFLIASAGYFSIHSIVALVIVRFLYGVGFGLTTTTFGTIAADVIPSSRMGEGMGYYGLSTSIAMAGAAGGLC